MSWAATWRTCSGARRAAVRGRATRALARPGPRGSRGRRCSAPSARPGEKPMTDFDTVERAVDEIRAGRLVLVVDDEDRENEGDMVMAADSVTAEHVNFLSKQARGLVCVSTIASRLDELHVGPMSPENTSLHGTPFAVSVDYRHGTSTGISAQDRAETIRAFTRPETRAADLARPGHIFPLRA